MADNSNNPVPSTQQVQRVALGLLPHLISRFESEKVPKLHGSENFYQWKKAVEHATAGTFAPGSGHKIWDIMTGKVNIGHIQGVFIGEGLDAE